VFEFQPDPGLQTIQFERPDLVEAVQELGELLFCSFDYVLHCLSVHFQPPALLPVDLVCRIEAVIATCSDACKVWFARWHTQQQLM